LDGRNKHGHAPLAIAINCNRRDCVERLLDAGAKISNVAAKIPPWFVELVTQRKTVKRTLIVLFALSRPMVGKDVAKMLISAVWETRDFPEWENKAKLNRGL
jgi:ankyrin repeat protein